MPKRPDNQAWRYWRMVLGVVVAAGVLVIGGLTGHVTRADNQSCAAVKCVALTFDDGPSPYTDRLLQILKDNDAKATFFQIGNKVAANPAGAKRVVDAGMELGSHTWEHPNMTTIPPEDIAAQFSRANDAIVAATGRKPSLYRPAGGLSNAAVRQAAGNFGLAEILWDVIPFDWANDSNTAATRQVLMAQIKPGSVVLFHDTYSSTVDLVYQFIPVLKANGYRLVTVSELLGPRAPGSSYGGRDNGPPVNELHDIPPGDIPALPNTPSPKPMPNLPITDIPGQNSGGPNNGA
ncbi:MULTISPECIES: polysaccharide deacetylase family protein [Mycobacterium]|uniref:Carbohydrate degradation protein n=1 Tax=Mycobacterium gordonae TaxID=1778 RepID=A0A1A6B8G2_MYCGO|nr:MULTISPECIES: polysaccharide deacetylase family protein [Mycobacterium]MBI2701677.1 polysaccharide deacetylase family protein [Mycobacterium sp.]MBX9979225.1 polysaccharide deacetylase family protein [Mycobacterium gordonae]MCQ4365024.1 polysaccharide deacetylase family protein [Mycobacterium gordonae]MCV7008961.1 polysaccharide deacetylase family protein [Mycobacterium gordonae]OBR98575.1 carbohydrate degradation protein [Mycobacterium gordonae]